MIFDIKMEDLHRKSRLVAVGHMPDAPATTTFASIVSNKTVQIALFLVGLNNLQVKVSDIENAYITAPCTVNARSQICSDAKKTAIVVRVLYGLKSAGASFCNHLADCIKHLGFAPCLTNPDLWMRAEVLPSDGFEYYAYMLLYVDDILVIHHNGEDILL